jgi:O-antigen/teichoic acid export membrane protein
MLRYLWRQSQPSWHGLNTACRKLLSYGSRSYGVDLLKTLEGQLDQVLIVGLLSPASLGIYAVALSLCRMLNVFQGALEIVLLPKLSARPVTEVVALVGRAMRVSTAITTLAGIIVMVAGPELVRILYGSEFIKSVALVRILAVQVTVDGAMLVLAQAFMALGRPGTITVFQAVGVGLCVPLLLLLIPLYGEVGAGLALLGSATIRLVLVLISFPLILKVRPPNLLITGEDLYFLKQRIFEKV